MAVCAKAQNKPFYVVAESFKFVRLFPLNQQDVPDKFKASLTYLKGYLSLKKTSEKCCAKNVPVRYSLPIATFSNIRDTKISWWLLDSLSLICPQDSV